MTSLPLPDLLTLCATRLREAAQHSNPWLIPGHIIRARADVIDSWADDIKSRMRVMRREATDET